MDIIQFSEKLWCFQDIKVSDKELKKSVYCTYEALFTWCPKTTDECTCISLPRPEVPKSSTPATSDAKRMQRVQWIHRVMIVFINGPISLSSTALNKNTYVTVTEFNPLNKVWIHAMNFISNVSPLVKHFP